MSIAPACWALPRWWEELATDSHRYTPIKNDANAYLCASVWIGGSPSFAWSVSAPLCDLGGLKFVNRGPIDDEEEITQRRKELR